MQESRLLRHPVDRHVPDTAQHSTRLLELLRCSLAKPVEADEIKYNDVEGPGRTWRRAHCVFPTACLTSNRVTKDPVTSRMVVTT